jgi:hypothetical protein
MNAMLGFAELLAGAPLPRSSGAKPGSSSRRAASC